MNAVCDESVQIVMVEMIDYDLALNNVKELILKIIIMIH